ncbi:hypothetical protein L2E82_38394 [Cichorium intybus]|uniref:Uncharacterized protein n=1 Tax=Cichorium intybus TaxID=13427 RepID=A0ACB9AH77_CICIN|nr:hypothetical protein L2E82_38394 [Cichorium intybus]
MVVVSATTEWFHTIDCETPKEGFSAGRPFPFKIRPSQDIRILTSVHGLNELWRMDEDGNWTKVVSTGLIFSSNIQLYQRLHLMRNGNVLIYDGACVYELDMKNHTIVLSSNANENMLVSPGGKYIETLVSPNQYIK